MTNHSRWKIPSFWLNDYITPSICPTGETPYPVPDAVSGRKNAGCAGQRQHSAKSQVDKSGGKRAPQQSTCKDMSAKVEHGKKNAGGTHGYGSAEASKRLPIVGCRGKLVPPLNSGAVRQTQKKNTQLLPQRKKLGENHSNSTEPCTSEVQKQKLNSLRKTPRRSSAAHIPSTEGCCNSKTIRGSNTATKNRCTRLRLQKLS